MREERIAMLRDTLSIFKEGYYTTDGKKKALKLTPEQMTAARVYLPDDVSALSGKRSPTRTDTSRGCRYSCENMDSFSLARKRQAELSGEGELKNGLQQAKTVLVLNLANPVHPGGGVRRGAKAQEEDLCRKSSLLLSLEGREAAPYYEYNNSLHTFMGSNAVIIHPQVEIIKDENGDLLEDSVVVAVLTCAAPMIKYGMERMTQAEYEKLFYDRITGMLRVAADSGYSHLILGAFGCGAFGNDARIVSGIFRKVFAEFSFGGMNTDELFGSIDFAVLDHSENQYNYREFSRFFSRSEG